MRNRATRLAATGLQTGGGEGHNRVAAEAVEVIPGRPAPAQDDWAGEPSLLDLQKLSSILGSVLDGPVTLRSGHEQLDKAHRLLEDYEANPEVRFQLLQLKEQTKQAGLSGEWLDLLEDKPDDIAVIRFAARSLVKDRRAAEAIGLLNRLLPENLDDARASLARAELLSDIQEHEASDTLFGRLIDRHESKEARISFAKRLRKRGLIERALGTLTPVSGSFSPGSKAEQLVSGLAEDHAFFGKFISGSEPGDRDVRLLAMEQAILHFRERDTHGWHEGGGLALVTGSLGAGGAERQLSRLAVQLYANEASRSPERPKMVEVIVKQHGTGPDGASVRQDFFLPDLLEAGVPVREISHMPPISPAKQKIDDADLLRLLGHLPPQVHYGVTRLAPYLRERAFNVASLWQDGACLFAALAALIAGTPIIHLVFRGLPPNIRRDRFRPEYDVLYKALAEIPGVIFISNSNAAAHAYAQWLNLPLERFHILYNGVPPIGCEGAPADEQKWADFDRQTADATETIGGVFRLEPAKRPLLWVKLAYRYLHHRPRARFVVVGHGRLHEQAMALAEELRIADRILFVGHSSHVGFWYTKMHVKVLLSPFEGLPNVLIEAQLLGVRTVSTPAGGAGECFIDGETGYLLKSAESPDLQEACEKIRLLADSALVDGAMTEKSIARAQTLFSVSAVVETFSQLCLPVMTARPLRHDQYEAQADLA